MSKKTDAALDVAERNLTLLQRTGALACGVKNSIGSVTERDNAMTLHVQACCVESNNMD